MTQKRYRIEDSLGLPGVLPAAPGPDVSNERLDQILNAILDLRRITQMSADETIETCRRELHDALAMRSELDLMKEAITRTKSELATLHRSENSGKGMRRAADELDAVVESTERATTQLLNAVEEIETNAGMLYTANLPPGMKQHVDIIQERVISAYEACNFQDLTGQRINKIVGVMKFIEEHLDRLITAWTQLDSFRDLITVMPVPTALDDESSLLNGPKLDDDPGHVDQNDIDSLFD
ncbi:chemotaxis protein [Methylobacterium sp. GXS13]|jgi:chemotaxis protein CheZ|uniref:protein phosphatase CheZ n=1 Tax=unclassified Methylobacterium TaxID=2615210 RepID=UPI00071C11DF|nr:MULTISPECIES: protein phosphatase CheZ [unclassified Methylobacterium]KST57087.1 chemotaxis protein [Methylobacterium sp. GXS13]MCJ2117579.1 protein phosphatase CheZ [Methylobacterium sp. J-001]